MLYTHIILVCLLTIPQINSASLKQANTWKEKFFDQKIDHYDYRVNNSGTYKQRYLVDSESYKGGSSPIFFYTGNEGDIILFAANTGLMWEFAAEFNALIIFAEHRYYGESLPFSSHSFANTSTLAFFTAEQALLDYVTLIKYLKTEVYSSTSPVVAFGGSYGGMLSAWLRMKYPGTVVGAYAASAPIWQFTGITPCETFNSITTRTYSGTNSNCPLNIRNSWMAIRNLFSKGGHAKLSSLFHLCDQIYNEDDLNALISALSDVWVSMAMADYPYPANFLGNLPAWPVNYTCNILEKSPANEDALLDMISEAIQVYTNYSKNVKCFDISNGGDSPALSLRGWSYQTCTQMVMPICSDGKNDMFESVKWDFDKLTQDCIKSYQVMPRELWAVDTFGEKKDIASGVSNIYFTNGRLDPWSGGGVLTQPSSTLHVYVISDGAHHVDLRASHSQDTESIKQARIQGKSLISSWIS